MMVSACARPHINAGVAQWCPRMAPSDGSDPAVRNTPIPLEGDGRELIGLVVDSRYRLDATLGRGGMGLRAHRATHVGLRRQVAVKILHPSLAASPEVRNRFEREALAVGKVDHPNCVATYDVGRLPDGSLYLAMELLEGRSLADVLEQEGQLAPGRALHILGHILRGLAGIHNAGLIHRDIKPENIILIRQGEDMDFAKILDFGIAKPMAGELSDDGVRLTQAGMAFGTPIYMAPEQALGNPMDGRADIYAAAVMGYEMLCGQPPFYSEDKLEVMSMHTAKPVPSMRSRLIAKGRPVPASLEKLIVRGLTKKPGDRYPDAESFLAAVENALHTPDGGVTDVNFERVGDTGSQPLIDDSGEVNIAGVEPGDNIGDAINEALQIAPTAARVTQPSAPMPRVVTVLGVEPSGGVPQKPKVDPPVVAPGQPRGRPAPGGVGIGIPYTGPSGEPIFGLTPEERLAQVPTKKRWPLIAGILGAAIVVGVGIAVVTAPSGGGTGGGTTGSAETKIDPKSAAGLANEALGRGDPVAAIQILDAAKASIDKDPDAQLVLGHAHAAQKQMAAALAAYRKALVLQPSLAENQTLRANLKSMANDKALDLATSALDVWVGNTDDQGAKDALMKAAVNPSLDRRHAARTIVDRYKLGAGVDWLTSYSLDLDAEPTCEKRREAVAHLRSLANPKAIPPLERAVGKRLLKRNACLIEDAHAAIGALKAPPK